jgi:hypothetical protein
MAAGHASVDVIDGIKRQGILPFVLGRLAQPGCNSRRNKYLVTERVDAYQQGIVSDTIIKNFAGDF